MAITLTESAAKQIRSQLEKRGKGLALRICVKKAGCSGMAYSYDYADEVRPDDHLFETYGAKVVVDAGSLPFIDGSCFDFVNEGLKQSFKFDNPNVDSMCGCGESFNVKTVPEKVISSQVESGSNQ